MPHLPFAQVAFPLPLFRTFTYRIPDAMAADVRPGAQVLAPFRGRATRGFVVELAAESALERIESLTSVTDREAVTAHMLALGEWIADYYQAPLGEVLNAALPGGLEGFAGSRARARAREDQVVHLALPERVTLTAEQKRAVAAIEKAVDSGVFSPILLHGVTASGKTEVYLRAADRVRQSGGQTLVMVPEVTLGEQVTAGFRRRFQGRVGVLHSYLTAGERRRNWELARRGGLDVVVGARSAVFAPLPRLGLIVVDEEHEPAYKQSEQLRYHGRDTAVRRAQMLGIPVVLGSATPSLESLANAARGRYTQLRLPHRIGRRPLPRVETVDLRRDDSGSTLLSRRLQVALHERLERGEQSLLFLNRRGHSHHTQCRACGWVPECPQCDITLTLHASPRAWRCHYCDFLLPFQTGCGQCGASLLRFAGAGTQRVERELVALLPQARVLRLDADSARARSAEGGQARGSTLAAFAAGKADVLVGTQMIAKGLDFPKVTLVGVLDADVSLHLPDFRAGERTWQLLVQVAGRAGRGGTAGEVLVQTCTPDHPTIAAAVRFDERAFLERELAVRREAGYPPYRRLVAVLFSGVKLEEVEAAASACADALRPRGEEAGVQMLGPAPQSLARLRGRYRWHLLLKGTSAGKLAGIAALAREFHDAGAFARPVRMVVDVDPVEVL